MKNVSYLGIQKNRNAIHIKNIKRKNHSRFLPKAISKANSKKLEIAITGKRLLQSK